MIDLILFICALIAIGLFIFDVMTRRKERKARRDYISKIERDWFEKLNKK